MWDNDANADCEKGYGCPDWAYNKYILEHVLYPDDKFGGWNDVKERFPVCPDKVLVQFGGLVHEAVYNHRCQYWILFPSYKVAFRSEIQFWKALCPDDYEEEE